MVIQAVRFSDMVGGKGGGTGKAAILPQISISQLPSLHRLGMIMIRAGEGKRKKHLA